MKKPSSSISEIKNFAVFFSWLSFVAFNYSILLSFSAVTFAAVALAVTFLFSFKEVVLLAVVFYVSVGFVAFYFSLFLSIRVVVAFTVLFLLSLSAVAFG